MYTRFKMSSISKHVLQKTCRYKIHVCQSAVWRSVGATFHGKIRPRPVCPTTKFRWRYIKPQPSNYDLKILNNYEVVGLRFDYPSHKFDLISMRLRPFKSQSFYFCDSGHLRQFSEDRTRDVLLEKSWPLTVTNRRKQKPSLICLAEVVNCDGSFSRTGVSCPSPTCNSWRLCSLSKGKARISGDPQYLLGSGCQQTVMYCSINVVLLRTQVHR